jgi:PRC-barrel domain
MSTLSHLQPARKLVRCLLHAVDGEIGTVEALYIDDVSWMVRYLLVDTGDWLADRRVLISPVAVGEVREDEKTIFIELTRRQIENSPPFDTDRPVSRRYEVEYYQYYDWPVYWEDDRVSGVALSSVSLETEPLAGREAHTRRREMHLQRTTRVNGCVIVAHDGAFGQVRDLIVDTRYWVIRYLEIETHRGRPGSHALVSPDWIERMSWRDHLMSIGLASTAIDSAPGFDPSSGISRDYEARLFKHYGRRGYWQRSKGMN